MAVITMDFHSLELKMNTLVTIVCPDSGRIGETPLSGRKVLYLLHGLSDDGTAWVRHSRVEQYAEAHGLVVVMPSGGRSFYCDGVNGQNYFTHITVELPAYLGLVFGLSAKREDTYIAGLSMGGMGAMRAALIHPEKYRAVGSFSGVIDLKPLMQRVDETARKEFPFLTEAMDDPDHSPLNPVALLDGRKHRDLQMYVACGLQDDLLPMSYSFRDRAEALGLSAEYTFEDGAHEWEFWNRHIRLFIDRIMGQ